MSKKSLTPADVKGWEGYGRWTFDHERYVELLEEHDAAVAEAYADGCMLEPEARDDAEPSPRDLAFEEMACAGNHLQDAAQLLHEAAERAGKSGDREEGFRLFVAHKILMGLNGTLYDLATMMMGLPTANPK